MAETVLGLTVSVRIHGTIAGTDGALKHVDWSYNKTFAEGTGTDQIGSAWEDESRTLAATNEDLDIRGGLTDFQGVALDLNVIKIVAFQNLDTDTGDSFTIEQGSANPVTTILGGTLPTLTVGPDGFVLIVNPRDGYAATAGSADKIGIRAADTSSYHILLAGDNA